MTSEELLIYIGAFGLALLILIIKRFFRFRSTDIGDHLDEDGEVQVQLDGVSVTDDNPEPDLVIPFLRRNVTIPLQPSSIISIGALIGALVGGISYSVPLYISRLYACGYPEAHIWSTFPVGAIIGAVCVFVIGATFTGRSIEKKKAALMGVIRGCIVVMMICLGCCAFSSIPDCVNPAV